MPIPYEYLEKCTCGTLYDNRPEKCAHNNLSCYGLDDREEK